MNRICLSGRIVNDLELRCTGQGKDIVSYTLACRRDKDTTDFIPCTTFGEFAKVLCQYCQKGDMVGVEGRLQVSSYEKDGQKHYSYNVLTDKVDFYNTKKEGTKVEETTQTSIKQEEIIVDDDMLPF